MTNPACSRMHRVGFREAATVLEDTLSVTFRDARHSGDEQRFLTIGMSMLGRLLVVAHADSGETIRLISARISFSGGLLVFFIEHSFLSRGSPGADEPNRFAARAILFSSTPKKR